ncbi:helix-turn-helix domain-containing protein [Actinoplanes sp. HUAS TT8]|uniref:helix-turn-helix domain-containing protein n=1 Tax=Actinoplanes sp. HUAS TT8 TaxID=3447453 RepID=UPI003F52581B
MTSTETGSTVPRRQLGRKLRELREQVPLTMPEAIKALEWSKPRLWRYETGQVPIHPNDVEAMCRLYGASADLTEGLKALARETKSKGWWHAYSEIPEWFQLFLGMESSTSRLRKYEVELIPGILQSPMYVKAIMSLGPNREMSPEAIEERVSMRIQRQRILTRREPAAPRLEVIVTEYAMIRGFGAKVMIDQLRRLLTFAELPNVSIRAVPLRSGQHTAYQGSFVIMDFPRQSPVRDPEPTTIYQEMPTGGLYLDKPDEVEMYSTIWKDLCSVSLDQGATKVLIEQKVKEWSDEPQP